MRLIDADKLTIDASFFDDEKDRAFQYVSMERIQDAPTIEAELVRWGKWELAKDGWYCTNCELYPPFDCDPEEKGIPYCPNCGAKMEVEK